MRRRELLVSTKKINYEYVDLGLPSGMLWAKQNVGAESESDSGDFYQWGSIEPFKNENQYHTGGTNSGYTLPSSADTATQVMGEGWRMPTNSDYQELINNTNYSWTSINGVNGSKFTSKKDSSKYVFFPAAGWYTADGVLSNVNEYVRILSSNPSSTANCSFYAAQSNTKNVSNGARRNGRNVRGVSGQTLDYGGYEYVDFGLSVKWAKYPLTMTSSGSSDLKYYKYTKGSTEYSIASGQSYDTSVYQGKQYLPLSADTAALIMGHGWRTPTIEEFQELFSSNLSTLVFSIYDTGDTVVLCSDKTDYTKNAIWMPVRGYYKDGRLYGMNWWGGGGDCSGFYMTSDVPNGNSQCYAYGFQLSWVRTGSVGTSITINSFSKTNYPYTITSENVGLNILAVHA